MNIVFTFSKRVSALAVAALAIAGCATSRAGADGAVSVVASTSVWADVAEQVVGRLPRSVVSVHAIVDNPSADPHDYEVSARDELAISRADVIVENGGGYDDFVGRMRSAAGARGTVIDAVAVSGRTRSSGPPNEHVWYDLPTVARVADRIAAVLAGKDPAHATTFRANARRFAARLHGLEQRETALARRYGGTAVAVTEPVPLYLLDACGLANRTPPAFAAAVEDGREVAPRVSRQLVRLFTAHEVRVLVDNVQTAGPQTADAVAAAKSAGIPVVGVTETLPAGSSFLTWMRDNLTAVEHALARGVA